MHFKAIIQFQWKTYDKLKSLKCKSLCSVQLLVPPLSFEAGEARAWHSSCKTSPKPCRGAVARPSKSQDVTNLDCTSYRALSALYVREVTMLLQRARHPSFSILFLQSRSTSTVYIVTDQLVSFAFRILSHVNSAAGAPGAKARVA